MIKLKCMHNGEIISLPLLKNGNLHVTVLQRYCDNAIGLTFKDKDDNAVKDLELIDNELIVQRPLLIHSVTYKKSDGKRQGDRTDSFNQLPERKRKLLEEAIAVLTPAAKDDTALPVFNALKKKKNNAGPARDFHLKISWKHRSLVAKKLQPRSDFGTELDLYLTKDDLSWATVVVLVKSKFYKGAACQILDKSRVTLGIVSGLNKQEEDINEFPDDNVIQYFKQRNINSRKKLYLFSYEIDPLETEISSHISTPPSNFEIQKNESSTSKSLSSWNSESPAYSMLTVKKSETPAINPVTNDAVKNCDSFQIHYSYLRPPVNDNGKWEHVNMPKSQLYELLKRTGQLSPSNISYSMFNPHPVQYPISQILMNGELLLNIVSDVSRKKRSFFFHQRKNDLIAQKENISQQNKLGQPEKHIILYGVNVLHGMCHNGDQFGVGVIPTCDDDCEPTMTWSKDGKVFAEDTYLYWITCDRSDDLWSHSWHCEVQCKADHYNNISKITAVGTKNKQNIPSSSVKNSSKAIAAKAGQKQNVVLSTEKKLPTVLSSSLYSDDDPLQNSIHQKSSLFKVPYKKNDKIVVAEKNKHSDRAQPGTCHISIFSSKNSSKMDCLGVAASASDNMNRLNKILESEKNSKLPTIDFKGLHVFEDHVLGKGGQGTVVKGRWKATRAAIKIVIIKSRTMDLLISEIKMLEVVNHPNIIQSLAISIHENRLYIVMERVDGWVLNDILFERNPSEEFEKILDKKAKIIDQICQAMDYLHMNNNGKNPMVHGDLKPENILITRDRTIKICDFGLSRIVRFATTGITQPRERRGVGTVIYMAPELINNELSSVQSDMWVIGCVIVEIYKRTRTWGDRTTDCEVRSMLRNRLSPNFEKIPSIILDLVSRCFSYIPTNRPNAGDFCQKYSEKSEDWSNLVTKLTKFR